MPLLAAATAVKSFQSLTTKHLRLYGYVVRHLSAISFFYLLEHPLYPLPDFDLLILSICCTLIPKLSIVYVCVCGGGKETQTITVPLPRLLVRACLLMK